MMTPGLYLLDFFHPMVSYFPSPRDKCFLYVSGNSHLKIEMEGIAHGDQEEVERWLEGS